jgi:N6-L-threonylcarbamoyladenine synthase
MLILGIETSCDETAASVVEAKNGKVSVLSNIVSSQVKLHSKWGGVVPNLAAREHTKNIVPVLSESLKKAKKSLDKIDLISVTNGPGLMPALLIGVNAAKALSYVTKKPLLDIHHIEGHIYANFIGENFKREQKLFPMLCLVVSGGHTQLIFMKKHLDYMIIGETLDDAAGEAFDKVARILGLGYPGGPAIAAMAARAKSSRLKVGSSKLKKYIVNFPRPMINSNNLNFSFSGLKTAVLYETKKHPELLKNKRYLAEICREFQQSATDVLISKTIAAAKKYKPRTIILAGGVSANRELRRQLGVTVKKELNKTNYHMPDLGYCIDNAAMIAAASFFRFKNLELVKRKSLLENWKKISADANKKLN